MKERFSLRLTAISIPKGKTLNDHELIESLLNGPFDWPHCFIQSKVPSKEDSNKLVEVEVIFVANIDGVNYRLFVNNGDAVLMIPVTKEQELEFNITYHPDCTCDTCQKERDNIRLNK